MSQCNQKTAEEIDLETAAEQGHDIEVVLDQAVGSERDDRPAHAITKECKQSVVSQGTSRREDAQLHQSHTDQHSTCNGPDKGAAKHRGLDSERFWRIFDDQSPVRRLSVSLDRFRDFAGRRMKSLADAVPAFGQFLVLSGNGLAVLLGCLNSNRCVTKRLKQPGNRSCQRYRGERKKHCNDHERSR